MTAVGQQSQSHASIAAPLPFGIINVSVANMRRLPVFQSETVNQVLLGTVVKIFEWQNDFYFVENWDGYAGWINRHVLHPVDQETAENWQTGRRVICKTAHQGVYRTADTASEVITELVPCAVVISSGKESGMMKVQLPDGRHGFTPEGGLLTEGDQELLSASPDGVIQLAKQFRGIPYFWGGITPKGFDCSGLVQTIFRMLNVALPRNASQMAAIGQEVTISSGLQQLQPADLLFFGNSPRRITHVAIYIGIGNYLHAEGYVKENSLISKAPHFNEMRRNTLLSARRIL